MFAESPGNPFADVVCLSIANQINIVENLVKQNCSQQNIFLSDNLILALAAERQVLADIGR